MAAVRVLNELQGEVLKWISEGCPDGVYERFQHRITARALAGKGLVKIKGHEVTWHATVTELGVTVGVVTDELDTIPEA